MGSRVCLHTKLESLSWRGATARSQGGAGPETNPSVCGVLATVAEVALGFPRVDA